VVQLVITVDAHLDRTIAFLASIPRAAEKAAARALNKAAAAAGEAGIGLILDRYAARAGDVREKITLTTAAPDRLGVAVVSRSSALALGYFPHSPTEIGTGGPGRPVLHAEVLRGQSKAVGGAFVAPIGGKPRIMIRTGGKTSTGKSAINSIHTVPIASMLGAESVREGVERRAAEVLDAQLGVEIDRELAKADR
jgi:hypothetical protein